MKAISSNGQIDAPTTQLPLPGYGILVSRQWTGDTKTTQAGHREKSPIEPRKEEENSSLIPAIVTQIGLDDSHIRYTILVSHNSNIWL